MRGPTGSRGDPIAMLMGVMAYGLWRARYWAVLGFQAILALLIVAATLGLVSARPPAADRQSGADRDRRAPSSTS